MTLPLPFGPAGLDPAEVWSVSDLNQAARGLLEQNMPPVWVRGEVTSFKKYASGHWYFTLQDGNAQVRCVMWRTWVQRARSKPEEGAEVHVFGTPGLWEEKGEFRFTATVLLRSDQLGQQQQQLEATRAALARDGLLDPVPQAAAAALSVDARGGDEPRGRGAARHRHRRPEPLAGRADPRGRRPGAGW